MAVRALRWIIAVRLGLWLLPFDTLRRWVERQASPRSSHSGASADQIVWAVGRASHYVPGAHSCLPRALVAHILFRREGYPSELHIGVALDEHKKLQAHAWVESQGRVLIGDTDLTRFTPLPTLPRQS